MRRALPAVLAAAVLLAGCGYGSQRDGPEVVLEQAAAGLARRDSGHIDLAVEASTGDSGPVGFAVRGPFSFEGEGALPVLDLTYTRLLGERRVETTVTSTGDQAWIEVDGSVRRLTAAETRGLRLDRGAEGLVGLDLSAWVDRPRLTKRGATEVVTGRADVPTVLRDLQRMAGADEASVGPLDREGAEHLTRRVRSTRVTVTTERRRLRDLQAVIDFGTEVPAALREAMGAYAAARFEVSLEVRDLRRPLRVRAPS